MIRISTIIVKYYVLITTTRIIFDTNERKGIMNYDYPTIAQSSLSAGETPPALEQVSAALKHLSDMSLALSVLIDRPN